MPRSRLLITKKKVISISFSHSSRTRPEKQTVEEALFVRPLAKRQDTTSTTTATMTTAETTSRGSNAVMWVVIVVLIWANLYLRVDPSHIQSLSSTLKTGITQIKNRGVVNATAYAESIQQELRLMNHNSSCWVERRCSSEQYQNNKILLTLRALNIAAPGRHDRLSIVNTFINMADYLCATVYLPAPQILLFGNNSF